MRKQVGSDRGNPNSVGVSPSNHHWLPVCLYIKYKYSIKYKTMKVSELKSTLRKILNSDKHIPAMLWSPPGIGKSSTVKQIADEMGIDFIDLRLSLLNPVDLRGLPYVNKETHKAEWLEPDFLPNGRNKKEGILFLDEINLAPASVMTAGYQLILDRKLGSYKLPEKWKILAAGNRAEDQANVTKFPAPLSNRFIHLDLEADPDEWRKWAFSSNIAEQIISFLGKFPQHLFKMPKAGERAFPTPRSWGQASNLHNLGLPIDSAVGEGTAAEFYAYCKIYDRLPDVDEILAGREKKVPSDLDVLWALSVAIAVRTEAKDFPNVFKYVANMPKEFEVITIIGISNKSESNTLLLTNSVDFSKWCERNKEVIESTGE